MRRMQIARASIDSQSRDRIPKRSWLISLKDVESQMLVPCTSKQSTNSVPIPLESASNRSFETNSGMMRKHSKWVSEAVDLEAPCFV
jgi:hypothetical protein